MASILGPSPYFFRLIRRPSSHRRILSSTSPRTLNSLLPPFSALRASGTKGMRHGGAAGEDPSILRRPAVSPVVSDEEAKEEISAPERVAHGRREEPEWVDWEDQILEETVPLVSFVRTILHSGKYEIDERLSREHETTILEKLLVHHPESVKKIGRGVDYLKVGLHPEFPESRCLFIVRNDGQIVDFSYWKCIKGLIRKKYPLYADSFILRHFKRRRPNE